MTDKKVLGVRSYETQQLVIALKKLVATDNYDVLTYAELSRICGKDVQHEGRGNLESAVRAAELETSRLFGTVFKEGVKLMTPKEQPTVATDGLVRIRRAVNRRIKRIGRVQMDKLDSEGRTQLGVAASVLGAMQMFSRPKSVEKIAHAVRQTEERLAIGETLKLFNQ